MRRLLEKEKNQRENIQGNITDDILRHAIRQSRLRAGMDGVLRYVNYKRHSSSKKLLGTKEEWLVVLTIFYVADFFMSFIIYQFLDIWVKRGHGNRQERVFGGWV